MKQLKIVLLLVFLLCSVVHAQTVDDLVGVGIRAEQAEVLRGDKIKSDNIPSTDDTYDLGSSAAQWKDLYCDGIAYVDTLYNGDGNAGNPSITFEGDTDTGIYRSSANAFHLVTGGVSKMIIGSIVTPGADDTTDLGSSSTQWKDLYIDGTAQIDVLNAQERSILTNGTALPSSPSAGELFLDTNDGACDNANDGAGTAVCMYNGSAWILLGNTGS